MPRRKRPSPIWLKRILLTPTAELNRWQYMLRFIAELVRHGMKQLKEDRAGQMAAALAFRTIFGLVPVTAIGLLIFRVLGGIDRFEAFLREMLSATPLGTATMSGADAASGAEGATVPLIDWLMTTIREINTKVNFESLGVVGLLVLVWAAIGMMTTIERSFNTICRASENRPMARRVPLYGFTIIIGPALLYMSFYLDRRFHEIIAEFAGNLGPWATSSLAAVGVLTSVGSTWLFILLLYMSVPNTRMKLSAAAIGSLVTAVFWSVGAKALGGYMSSAVFSSDSRSSYAVLYGTLGLIPVFLFWVYAMWIIVLFGLELTSALQAVGMRMVRSIPDRPNVPPVMDPALVLPMLRVVAERFEQGEPTDARQIMEQTHISERAIELVLATLAVHGVLHRVEPSDRATFALARPPQKIALSEVVGHAQRLLGSEDGIGRDWPLVSNLRQAQIVALGSRTLADLLPSGKKTKGAAAGGAGEN